MTALSGFVSRLSAYDMELRPRRQQRGQQARVVELSDEKTVTKAVQDLRFLSTQSPAYRSGTAALSRIGAALKTAGS